MRRLALLVLTLVALLPLTSSRAGRAQTEEQIAHVPSWFEPTEPFQIVGPIYYVGTKGLGVYLIVTSDGLIMLDGGMPQSAADIEASVRALGFDPADIKLLLITHGHIDHAGTTAYFKELSGSKVAVMDRDVPYVESGGVADPQYGDSPAFHFPAFSVDRVLHDGDTITLGDMTLTARLGAGHTRGATTWSTTVEQDGESYDVVFPCCAGVNPGMSLVVDPIYPGMVEDYRTTYAMLASLEPDIWLAAHTESFGFQEKRERMASQGVTAWVDPAGYQSYVAAEAAKFEALVATEATRLGGPVEAPATPVAPTPAP